MGEQMKLTSVLAGVAFLGGLLTFGAVPRTASAAGACVAPGGAGGCLTTIQAAVTAAAAGDTITVAAGTYNENVVIQKPLTLQGAGAGVTTLSAISSNPTEGLIIKGVTSGATVISGFTIQNAALSGVLVSDSSNVTVQNNTVRNNDKNLLDPSAPGRQASCPGAFPFDQDDCGEAIHLRGASNSQVLNNIVKDNVGGILLTDETGPTHDNTIDGNTVLNNIRDCGITLPSHPSKITPPSTPNGRPSFTPGFGVYNNKVTNNISSGNGGAGVGIFASVPGTAAYNNLVQGNTLMNNGNGGVSLHSHAPGQNLNGNQILGNTIGTNNVQGDSDAGDLETTGILVMGAVVPVRTLVITGNTITGNAIGIWLANTPGAVLGGNHISADTPIVHATPPQQLGENQFPEQVAQVGFTSSGTSSSFTVGFESTQPGQGEVYFGSGPGCSGLVEVATQDQGAGSTDHTVRVAGNDLPGSVGDNGIVTGATYYYELVTFTSSGTQIDNNGGNCYQVTIPAS